MARGITAKINILEFSSLGHVCKIFKSIKKEQYKKVEHNAAHTIPLHA